MCEYNPVKFLQDNKIVTISVIGAYVSWKLFGVLYECLYSPLVDNMIDTNGTENYYFRIGNNYIRAGPIFEELIKWSIIIVTLMFFYNYLE
jgi:hypothetical protein